MKELFYIYQREKLIVFQNRTNHQQPQALGGNQAGGEEPKPTESGRPGSNPASLLLAMTLDQSLDLCYSSFTKWRVHPVHVVIEMTEKALTTQLGP